MDNHSFTCAGQPGGDGTRPAHDGATTSGGGNDIANSAAALLGSLHGWVPGY